MKLTKEQRFLMDWLDAGKMLLEAKYGEKAVEHAYEQLPRNVASLSPFQLLATLEGHAQAYLKGGRV